MLNIIADALLIAARLGHLPEDRAPRRRSPRDFEDVEALRTSDRRGR